MTPEQIKDVMTGDVLRNVGTGHAYVVIANVDGQLVAVRTVTVTNPDEWDIIGKFHYHIEKNGART